MGYKVSIDKAVVQFSFFEEYCASVGNKTADTPLNPDKDKSNTIATVLWTQSANMETKSFSSTTTTISNK